MKDNKYNNTENHDIVLINPPLLEYPVILPPLGISYLKAYCEKMSNHKVFCFDLAIHFLNTLHFKIEFIYNIYNKFKEYFEILITSNGDIGEINLNIIPGLIDSIKSQSDFNNTVVYNSISNKLIYINEYLLKPMIKIIKYMIKSKNEIDDDMINLLDIDKIIKLNPKIVGFSIMFDNEFICSILMSSILKKINNNLIIVYGGAFFSFVDLEEIKKISDERNIVDYIVVGDGEETFLKIIESCYDKGIIFNKKIIRYGELTTKYNNYCAKNTEMLDRMPFPDFSNYDFSNYHVPILILPILGSRGCHWGKCTFCNYDSNYVKNTLQRSTQNIVQEIKNNIKKYNCSFFTFADSGISYEKLLELSNEILDSNIKIYFECMSRPEYQFTKKENLIKLKKSGLSHITFGIESFTQRILNLMFKGTKVSDIKKILQITNEINLSIMCFYIIGFPSQTLEELLEEVNNILNYFYNIGTLVFSHFTVLKNAALLKNKEITNNIDIIPNSKHTIVEIGNTNVYSDIIYHKNKSNLTNKDTVIWVELLNIISITLGSMYDEYYNYIGLHKMIRIVYSNLYQNQIANAIPNKEYLEALDDEISILKKKTKLKNLIEFLEKHYQYSPIMIEYLISVLNKKIEIISS